MLMDLSAYAVNSTLQTAFLYYQSIPYVINIVDSFGFRTDQMNLLLEPNCSHTNNF